MEGPLLTLLLGLDGGYFLITGFFGFLGTLLGSKIGGGGGGGGGGIHILGGSSPPISAGGGNGGPPPSIIFIGLSIVFLLSS